MQLLLERKFIFIAVVWTILITTLSLITIEKAPLFVVQLPFKDKIVHFIFYFFLVFLWSFGLRKKINHFRFKILIGAIFYGIIIEVLQGAVTVTRTADFYDVIANSIGAYIAYINFPILERNIIKQEQKIKK
ncbi:VanZ family protein [Flavobacterium sp.]|jgi:VanZ family protein|uniref:VanZ family protein n=1 Tax=Flavobacterium sp. TaxID=239 RepID=UPI002A824B59|nr:VanZ family protein [Flavobacterium sp.]